MSERMPKCAATGRPPAYSTESTPANSLLRVWYNSSASWTIQPLAKRS